ncbi:MAG: HAD-IC family P-type ATPase, partial [Clostridia bacterium]|nr:HAD-IC family P-type ATPase [Clostridia bacterium]
TTLLQPLLILLKQIPFSSKTKEMETVVRNSDGYRLYVKGAPEIVLSRCVLSEKERIKTVKRLESFEREAKRALCFAHADGKSVDFDGTGLIFDGFAVITDPVRKDVYGAVKRAHGAGINVKMLTGDNILTATAIAKELKIITDENQAITASEAESMTDDELKEKLKTVNVIARSTPQTKLRVVRLLKESGEAVAVTGDGINDAPAVKHADVGIAMGISGSEITKESADIVLLNDSFSTIIKAVEFGRNVYENLQRFILFQLSVNLSALLFIVISLVCGLDAPFNTLQLLWINVIMDGPPALTLGLETTSGELMTRKPVSRDASIVSKKMLFRIFFTGIFTAVVTALEYRFDFLAVGEKRVRTATFTLFIAFQLFNAFNARQLGKESILKNVTKNKIMLVAFAFTFVLHVLIVTFGGFLFGVVPLDLVSWAKTLALAFTVIPLSEGAKLVYNGFLCRKRK